MLKKYLCCVCIKLTDSYGNVLMYLPFWYTYIRAAYEISCKNI